MLAPRLPVLDALHQSKGSGFDPLGGRSFMGREEMTSSGPVPPQINKWSRHHSRPCL